VNDRTRRWLSWAAVAVIAAIACALLGRWQFSRYETKANNVALVQENFNSEPGMLGDLLDDGSFDPGREWMPVLVTGEYVGQPVILPQRGIPGQAGDHVLSLFVTDEETPETLVIDRGWYPVNQAPADLTAPPGTVSVVGRARPAEPTSPRGVRDHQVFAVDAAQVLEAQDPLQTPNVQASLYLMAAEGEPGQEDLGAFPEPAADLGNHLSYAFQWWIFSAGAFVGLGVVIRRDIKSGSAAPPRKQRMSRDAAEEDALIEAQLSGE